MSRFPYTVGFVIGSALCLVVCALTQPRYKGAIGYMYDADSKRLMVYDKVCDTIVIFDSCVVHIDTAKDIAETQE